MKHRLCATQNLLIDSWYATTSYITILRRGVDPARERVRKCGRVARRGNIEERSNDGGGEGACNERPGVSLATTNTAHASSA